MRVKAASVILSIICAIILQCESYRILGIFPMPMQSHNIFLTAVAKSLVEHNHQVDMITGFELKNPPKNYNVVVNLSDIEVSYSRTYNFLQEIQKTDRMHTLTESYGKEICEYMGLDRMQKFISELSRNPGYYDAVIVEVSLSELSLIKINTIYEHLWL